MGLFNIGNEQTASRYIPYTSHYTNSVVGTKDDDVLCTIHLQGAAHETMHVDELNALDASWKSLTGSMSRSGRVALWAHIVRKKITYDHSLQYENSFSQSLADTYGAKLSTKQFFVNDIYLTPVYRASTGAVEGLANSINRKSADDHAAIKNKGIQEVGAIATRLEQSLRKLAPHRLGIEKNADGYEMSEAATFYCEILNGRTIPIPARRNAVHNAIQNSELNFGDEVIEIAGNASSRYVGLLGLKAPYSVETLRADILHSLFSAPIEYILSQSLVFNSTSDAEKFLRVQLKQFESTEGTEILQAQLVDARNRLQAGQYSMCGHEFTLAIYGDTILELNQNIQIAEAALIEKSIQVIRHSRGMLIAQYFGMLPGNFSTKRLASQPLSSDNFAAFFPLHNYLVGSAQGSQWGMPVALVETPHGAPYFINFHNNKNEVIESGFDLGYSDVDEEAGDDSNALSQKTENGNARFIGNAGDGKTVAQTFLRSMLQKKKTVRGPYTSYAFDNDLGQLIYINAIGGQYFEFRNGEKSGINLFSLVDTPRNRDFILTMIKWCAEQDRAYVPSVDDEKQLQKSINFVYTQQSANKQRFARVLDYLQSQPLKTALGRWVGEGAYAWVLDNQLDRFDLTNYNAFGFDMTDFLQNELAKTPIISYLFHKINESRSGKPYSIDIDEAGIALADPGLQVRVGKEARTIRKKNGIITLATQNPLDLSAEKLEGTLINQLPTGFYFPNPTAKWAEYEALGLSRREFELVKSGMSSTPGTILLKKGITSNVIRIDLSGMNQYLAVLSGNEPNVLIYREIRQRLGQDAPPEVWLPEFYKRRV